MEEREWVDMCEWWIINRFVLRGEEMNVEKRNGREEEGRAMDREVIGKHGHMIE